MFPLRRLVIPAIASTLALILAGIAPPRAVAAVSSCPLFSYFTTSPAPANDHEPTIVTLLGCYPYACGEIVQSRILGPTEVEVTMRERTGCADTVQTWAQSFDLGVLAAGSHNLVITVRDAATPLVGQVFGSW